MGVRAVRLASLYPAGGDTPPLQEGLYRNDTSIADPQSNGGLQPKLLEPMPARNVRRREAPFVLGVRPPKNPVPRFPEDNPSVTFGDQRGPIGPFSLRNVHRTFLRALEPPYTGEPGWAAQRRPYGNVVFVILPLSLIPIKRRHGSPG